MLLHKQSRVESNLQSQCTLSLLQCSATIVNRGSVHSTSDTVPEEVVWHQFRPTMDNRSREQSRRGFSIYVFFALILAAMY